MVLAVARMLHRGGFVVLGSRAREQNGGQGEHLKRKSFDYSRVCSARDPAIAVLYHCNGVKFVMQICTTLVGSEVVGG
jgi:hypothetical protein